MPAGLGSSAWRRFSSATATPVANPQRELLARLRNGAEGRAGELEIRARRQIVLALVSALEPIVARISELTIEIRNALDAHPDGATFRSLFIAADSWLCAATMLSEIGDCRERYPTYRAPGRRRRPSPGRCRVRQSQTRPVPLGVRPPTTRAFDTLADSSRRHNPWAADIYKRARARGASHAHASRILGRAWSQIIWRLWHDHDTYDPPSTPPANA